MTLEGRVTHYADPMTTAVRGMITQIHLLNVHTNNIAYADIPGYQKREPVVTSFTEYLGHRGINEVVNTAVGRLHMTAQPLDLALATRGYFQKQLSDGQIDMTRDGRFRLDKNGNLLSIINEPILSRQGTPIKLPFIPKELNKDHIQIDSEGWISVINPKSGEIQKIAQISVVSEDGSFVDEIDVRQGYVEASNVFLHEEYVAIVPAKRNFQANRQVFLIQSQILSRLIQEMGRAQ